MTVEEYILKNNKAHWKVFKNGVTLMTDKTIKFMMLDSNEEVYECLTSEIITVIEGIDEVTLVI